MFFIFGFCRIHKSGRCFPFPLPFPFTRRFPSPCCSRWASDRSKCAAESPKAHLCVQKSESPSVSVWLCARCGAQPRRWEPGTKHLKCTFGLHRNTGTLLPFLQPGELVLLELEARLSSSTLGHLMSAALLKPPTPWRCSGAMRGPQFPTLRDRGTAAKFMSAHAKSSGLTALKPLQNWTVLWQPHQSRGCCFPAAAWPGCVLVPAVGCWPSARFLARQRLFPVNSSLPGHGTVSGTGIIVLNSRTFPVAAS